MQDWLSRIRVPAGFVMAVVYFYFSRPTWPALAFGCALAVPGLLRRAWATGHLRKNDQLAVTGPYGLTRNPLYFGSFLLGGGFSIAGRNLWILVAFLAGFAAVYGNSIRQEAKHLRRLFPGDYPLYEQRVPLFWPRVWNADLGNSRFSIERYWRNREYEALLGFLGAVIVLVLKIRFA